jgi:hypothetical protein
MESKLSINAEDIEEDKNDRSWLQRTGTQGRCDDQSPVLLSVVAIGERSSARRSETCVSETPDFSSRTSKYVGMEVEVSGRENQHHIYEDIVDKAEESGLEDSSKVEGLSDEDNMDEELDQSTTDEHYPAR